MAEILVYENYAYLSDVDRQRHGMMEDAPGEKFAYEGLPPQELWRVEGSNGTMLSVDFKDALKAFQMGGNRMNKIEIVVFED